MVYAICPHCKKKIECKNESSKSIVAKYGAESGVISHFECSYEYVNGEKWKEPKWLKQLNSRGTQVARELPAK